MSVRRSLLVLMLVMALLPPIVFSLHAQQVREQRQVELEKIESLDTYAVGRGRVESIVSALGTLKPDREVQMSFRVPGRVETIFVEQGNYVFPGESLIQLQDENQRIAYDQAVLARDRAEIELVRLLEPVSNDDLQIAQASIDSAWGQYLAIENRIGDADVRAAELAYQQALDAYNQVKQSRDQAPGGFGSDAYITLDAQTGAASFNAEIARLQLEDLQTALSPQLNAAYAQVILAQRQYDRIEAGPTEFEVESAALQVRQAESQLRRAESNLNRMTLTAPIEGFITSITAEQGVLVAPGISVVEITDVSPLRLTVSVDEIDVRLLREGMTARIELDALTDVTIFAEVQSIGILGNNEGGVVSYEVELTLAEPIDDRVRIGMTAEANIIIDVRDDVLIVPNYYIRRDGELAYVNVLVDDELAEREVVLGLQGREFSEILSGLEENEVIAVDFSQDRFSIFGE